MFWRGKNKFNHLEMVGAKRLIGFGALSSGLGSPQGNTYYVDNGATNAGDDNEGLDVNYPLETIDGALAKCTNDNDDYVIVLDCYDADTYPISLDIARCHVIGLSNPTPWSWAVLSGGGDDVFNFAANYVELAGFNIASAEAAGWAVYLNGTGCEGWMVCHNWAAQTATSQGNNPYKDTSTGSATTNKNGWADNYDGSALVAAPDYS